MLPNLSFCATVVSHVIASGRFGTRALGCPNCLHITEAAVNWALKEMETLRWTILVEEVMKLKSLKELRSLQDHLQKSQGKDWEGVPAKKEI